MLSFMSAVESLISWSSSIGDARWSRCCCAEAQLGLPSAAAWHELAGKCGLPGPALMPKLLVPDRQLSSNLHQVQLQCM